MTNNNPVYWNNLTGEQGDFYSQKTLRYKPK